MEKLRFFDELEKYSSAKTDAELMEVVNRRLSNYGISSWLYALDLPYEAEVGNQYTLGEYPKEWLSHYIERDYLSIDPVIPHALNHTTPLIWPRERKHFANKEQERFFSEAGEFNLRSGVTVPMHGFGFRFGLLSFASDDRSRNFEDEIPEIFLLAHAIHDAAHQHAVLKKLECPKLTKREIQCLTWAAAGKTSNVISELLNISERTVVFHLDNINRKFGCHSRHATIARAVNLGVIKI